MSRQAANIARRPAYLRLPELGALELGVQELGVLELGLVNELHQGVGWRHG